MSGISWWRSWHGAPTDHKWPVIAARSGVKVGIVSAIAWALMDYASQQPERGSVAGFDPEEYAVYSGFEEVEIVAVIQAMTDKGIISNGNLSNWEKRQPKREDDSAERVREFRAKKRNVTQGNAPEKEEDTDKESDKDTDKDIEKKTEKNASAPDPFDAIQQTVESKGIILAGEADILTITELVNIGATPEDVLAGIAWKAANNNGKAIRYISALIGPTKTAMAKRLQAGPGHTGKEFAAGEGGRVSL